MLADFDIGAVERADRERAVERELHVAGAGSFHAGGGNLLRQIGGRNDLFGEADAVIRHEHHFQPVADHRIGIDHRGDVVGELDDQLGALVARRRLAGEDLHPRHPVLLRLRADRLVERDRLQDVEQLALVFVDALDLHVEQRVRRHAQPVRACSRSASRHLLARAPSAYCATNSASSASGSSSVQAARIVEHALAERAAPATPVSGSLASYSQRRKVMPLVLLTMRRRWCARGRGTRSCAAGRCAAPRRR